MEDIKPNRQFVEELAYENIKLVDQNTRLILENYRLRQDLKELKRLERWWRGE
jgi:regulator of replication initiation timing